MTGTNIGWKLTGTLLGAAAVAAGAVVFAAAPGKSGAGQKGPFYGRYFAHRGLHTADGSAPENSLTAFRMAANVGYGVELDVHLTKDGRKEKSRTGPTRNCGSCAWRGPGSKSRC